MPRFLHWAVLAPLLASACQQNVVQTLAADKGKVSRPPLGAKSASPTAKGDDATSPGPMGPADAASAGADSLSTLIQRLRAPATGTRTLTGTLSIDAAYVLNTTQARLISDRGLGMVAVGAAEPDDALGRAVLDLAGGNIISDNVGGVISEHGGSLLSNNGGALVSNNSSNLIGKIRSENGGGLIGKIRSEGGGGLIGKLRFRVNQVDTPPVGTVAAAAGVAIRVFDVATGAPLPIGVDANGVPAYEVLTGAGGRFEVFPPAASNGSIVIHAGVPDIDDRRLRFDLVTSGGSGIQAVDEDSSLATHYLHRTLKRSYLSWFNPEPLPADLFVPFHDDPAKVAVVIAGRRRFKEESRRLGIDRLPPAQREALAGRITDLLLSRVDPVVTPLYLKPNGLAYAGKPEDRVFESLVEGLRAIRAGASKKMQVIAAEGRDPFKEFSSRSYVIDAEKRRGEPFEFRKPTDVADFVLEAYLGDPTVSPMEVVNALLALGADLDIDLSVMQRLEAAALGYNLASSEATYASADGKLLEDSLKLMRAAAPAAAPPP